MGRESRMDSLEKSSTHLKQDDREQRSPYSPALNYHICPRSESTRALWVHRNPPAPSFVGFEPWSPGLSKIYHAPHPGLSGHSRSSYTVAVASCRGSLSGLLRWQAAAGVPGEAWSPDAVNQNMLVRAKVDGGMKIAAWEGKHRPPSCVVY